MGTAKDKKTGISPGKGKGAKSSNSTSSPRASKATAKTPKVGKNEMVKREITPEEHYRMVQTAAYFRAQRDGFKGDSMNYWIEAEKEIKSLLEK